MHALKIFSNVASGVLTTEKIEYYRENTCKGNKCLKINVKLKESAAIVETRYFELKKWPVKFGSKYRHSTEQDTTQLSLISAGLVGFYITDYVIQCFYCMLIITEASLKKTDCSTKQNIPLNLQKHKNMTTKEFCRLERVIQFVKCVTWVRQWLNRLHSYFGVCFWVTKW